MSRRSSICLKNNVCYGENVEEEPSPSTASKRSIPVNTKKKLPKSVISRRSRICRENVEEEPSPSTASNRSIPVNTKKTARNTRASRNVEMTIHTSEPSEVNEVNEVNEVVDLDQRSSVFYSVLIAKACATLIILSLLFWSLHPFVSSSFSPSNPDGHPDGHPDGLELSMETGFVSVKPDLDSVPADVETKMERFWVDMQQNQDHFLEEIKHSVHLNIQDMKAHVDEVSSNSSLKVSAVEKHLTDHQAQWNSESASLKLQVEVLQGVIAKYLLSLKGTTPQVPHSDSSSFSPQNLTPELEQAMERWIRENKPNRPCQGTICAHPMADRMADFALESKGGSVISTRCSETYNSASVTVFGYILWRGTERPAIVIQGNTVLRPGKCWAFSGTQGTLLISLSQPVSITHVTLDHIPRNISPTGRINSAPQDFQVFGMNNENEAGTLLGSFTYDQNGEPTQTFELPHPSNVHHIVELRVLTNWGQTDYTCLYRFRVHGKEVSNVSNAG